MPESAARAPVSNRLLDELPARDRARLMAVGERVDLRTHEVIGEPGTRIRHVYFPLGGFISLVAPMGGRRKLEVALAGNEGFYGVGLALGIATSPVHALVQGDGPAIRIPAAAFERELERMPRLRRCIQRYAFVVMGQLMRAAGCSRFHLVEERLARWLLMTADRSHSPSFHITHEFLADMLGVRREGVTQAATALQKKHLIRYARGAVSILDRKGLESASCSCYRADLATYDGVFGASGQPVRKTRP